MGGMQSVTISARLEVQRLAALPDFGQLLRGLAGRRGLVALDSVAGEPRRWSWIAFDPREDFELPRSPAGLGAWMESAGALDGGDVPGPFAGGFLGALAYDAGVHGEGQDLPADGWDWPHLVGGFYTDFFVFDHEQQCASLVTLAGRADTYRDILVQLAQQCCSPGEATASFRTRGELQRLTSSAEHRARVQRARQEIAAGEYYQANLAHAFEVPTQGDPLELYLELRRVNPAPYMAYLRFEGGALLSASPELLLEVQDRKLRARPIKGTAERSDDAARDAQLARELLASDKDRAELAMIVDLLRNDLGRVARIGSVRVDDFPELRSYAAVHHLMADVHAHLAEDRGTLDALLAVFPGGSITGAPKLRSMDAIAELEGSGRGYFSGSAGFLDTRGNACFNILIRTMQWRPEPERGSDAGRVRFHVGGGITWSSDPAAEDRETLLKGARLARALGQELELDPKPTHDA